MSFNTGGVNLTGQFHLKNTDPIDSRYLITTKDEYEALTTKNDDGVYSFLYPGLTFTVDRNLTLDTGEIVGEGLYRVGVDDIIHKLSIGNTRNPVYFDKGIPKECGELNYYQSTYNKANTIYIKEDINSDLTGGSSGDIAFIHSSNAGNGLTFTPTSSTECSVSRGNDTYTQSDLIIPPVAILGHIVKSVSDWGFYGCSSLTNVTLPNSITQLGNRAFCHCWGLKDIKFPNSLKTIGKEALYSCTDLASLTIPFIGSSPSKNNNGYLGYLFSPSDFTITAYESINQHVPESLKTIIVTGGSAISSYAFCKCSGLESVIIGDSATSIGNNAFYDCAKLKSVTIGKGVKSIGSQAFYGCTALKSLTINSSSVDTALQVFEECSSLTNFTGPSSVLYYLPSQQITTAVITGGAIGINFNAYTNLTDLTINIGVPFIDTGALLSCKNLKVIKFNGTKLQWRDIVKGTNWTTVSYVQCIDGDVSTTETSSSSAYVLDNTLFIEHDDIIVQNNKLNINDQIDAQVYNNTLII